MSSNLPEQKPTMEDVLNDLKINKYEKYFKEAMKAWEIVTNKERDEEIARLKSIEANDGWIRLDKSHFNMAEGFLSVDNPELTAKEKAKRLFEYILGVDPETLPTPPNKTNKS